MRLDIRSFLLGMLVLEGVLILGVISFSAFRSMVLTSSERTPSPETQLSELATVPTVEATAGRQLLFITNTGGVGVRLREACTDDAPGVGAWPEGTAVIVVETTENCRGWLLARGGQDETSWVLEDYLSTRPQPASPTALPIVAQQQAAPTTTPVPVAPLQPDPGLVSNVSVSATPISVTCGGSSFVTVVVHTASGGRAIDGTPVTVSTNLGTVSPTSATTRDGGVRIIFTAPFNQGGAAMITAISGGQSGRTFIQVDCSAEPIAVPSQVPVTQPCSYGSNSDALAYSSANSTGRPNSRVDILRWPLGQ